MRIALVSQEYPPETAKGGMGSQAFIKAHSLVGMGHHVHVISRTLGGRSLEYDDAGVHVTRVPGLDARMGIYTEAADWLGYSTEVAAALASLHARTPVDVAEFPEWGAEGYVHLLNQTQWNRIPTVIHVHGPLVMFAQTMGWPALDSELYRTGTVMEGTCLRLADAVFSSSACSAEWCARAYGLDRASIPIIHSGVDTALFAPHPVPKATRPTVIFTGKLVANKGINLLLESACELVREFPGLHLRLLGRGDSNTVAELRARAESAGVPGVLDLPGFVERDHLPDQLSRAHVFAAPSEYEGGPGFAYLEAMACGLPVIACGGSGAAEAVRHDRTGLLIPPHDVRALTSAVGALLRDPGRRQAMGESARRFVLAEADGRVCMKRIEEFYRAVAERTSAQRAVP